MSDLIYDYSTTVELVGARDLEKYVGKNGSMNLLALDRTIPTLRCMYDQLSA